MSAVLISFAQNIKQLRESKGLSQQQLGEIFGSPKQTVWNWEKGTAAPPLPLLCEIADFFQVSLDFLVGRTDNPKVSRSRKKSE